MVASWPVAVAVGTVLGFLSGLGIGGGSLLILWLTLVLGMEPAIARGINLLFFLPAAGCIQWKLLLPAVAGGCISAVLCSMLSLRMDMELLKKLFGGLLIVTGLRELFYRQKSL